MSRYLAVVAAWCLSVSLLAAPSVSAHGQTQSGTAAGEAEDTHIVSAQTSEFAVSKAEREDLKIIAQTEGISPKEAEKRYGWQVAFGSIVELMRTSFPDSFAEARMNQDGMIGGLIRFDGPIPEGASELVTGLPVDVTLKGDAAHSELDVQSAVEAAHFAVRGEAEGRSVSTEYDESSQAINSTVYLSGAESPTQGRRLASIIEGALAASAQSQFRAEDTADIPVTVTTVFDKEVGDEVIRGGALLGGSSSSSFACTSGWPVERVNSTQKGLVTAEHCPDSMSYSGRFVLTWRSRIPLNGGDVQYMSSSETVGNQFYYGVGNYRTVTGRGTPSQDQYLCVFGRTTGNSCDNVRDIFTCRDNYCNLVSMDTHPTDNGDSGGPWYYGSTAYGVHSGVHFSFPRNRSQFTPLYNVLANMELRLRTG